jgi:hypothetical protein
MDKQVRLSLHTRALQALAALLPDAQRDHPDARLLADPHTLASVDERVLTPLVQALELTDVEHAAVALALWIEFDARLGAALALLQGSASNLGSDRPSLGLVASVAAQLFPESTATLDSARAIGQLLRGNALASGLLRLGDGPQPMHARALHLQPALLAMLAHGPSTTRRPTPGHLTRLGQLALVPLHSPNWPLPLAWRQASTELGATLDGANGPSVVLLRGSDAGELRAVAAVLANALGQRACEICGADDSVNLLPDTLALLLAREGVVPALLLERGIPVWHADLGPGRTTRIPELPYWRGPFIVLAAADSAFETALPLHEFELTPADASDRLNLWSSLREIPAQNIAAQDQFSIARSRCGISVLAQAASGASAALPAHAAIEQAVRSSARSLTAWAQVSIDRIPADAWVGPPDVHRALGLLLTRCLARADASAQLGPLLRGRLSQGVKALLIGASGTGKTLAAQWLADRLARPLVRVDLAAVVSKYIGETEKNLAQLLSRAEHLDAVLLFDEADSLFGARTDVKQANDRYANMQTNYLLQRLETFHGVAVLTSNSKARFDDAFLRRLDTVVEFPLPDVAERRVLWSLHLGDAPQLDCAVLNAVAALVDLPGGHIRNAVLTAALLARQRADGTGGTAQLADSADAKIQTADLREALALEYRKLGQRVPDSL